MSLTRWYDWAQVAGIFALVGSLVFVGLQMRQTQQIALAAQYQARAESAHAMLLAQMETGESILMLAGMPSAEMNEEQRAIMSLFTSWAWIQYDNHYYQFQAGFLDEEAWTAMQNRIQELYDGCSTRRIFEYQRPFLRASFVRYVASLEDTCS